MKTLITSLLVATCLGATFVNAGEQPPKEQLRGKLETGRIVYLIGKHGTLVAYRIETAPTSPTPSVPAKPGQAGVKPGKLPGKTESTRALIPHSTTPIQVQQISPAQVAPEWNPSQQVGQK